MIKSR
jgi:Protein of unknown function (DUF3593)